jgi:hypothetical protein
VQLANSTTTINLMKPKFEYGVKPSSYIHLDQQYYR